jgi:hypothetical protein
LVANVRTGVASRVALASGPVIVWIPLPGCARRARNVLVVRVRRCTKAGRTVVYVPDLGIGNCVPRWVRGIDSGRVTLSSTHRDGRVKIAVDVNVTCRTFDNDSDVLPTGAEICRGGLVSISVGIVTSNNME